MAETLEQKRAADAWEQSEGKGREYVNLAKGLSALIMNSGLIQVLAFLQEKGRKQEHCKILGEHLRSWLSGRFPNLKNHNFSSFMEALLNSKPMEYQQITTEAHAWLRWMRQMAAANNAKGE